MTRDKLIYCTAIALIGLTHFSAPTYAAGLEHRYGANENAVHISHKENIELRNIAQNFWHELSAANFSLDSNHSVKALRHIQKAREWIDHIARLSNDHSIKTRIPGARLLYDRDGQEFEYFFPLSKSEEGAIERNVLLALRDQNSYAEKNIDINLYEIELIPSALKETLTTIEESIKRGNDLEARISLESLKHSLFVSSKLEEGAPPQDKAIDWINLGLSMLYEHHFDTLHFALQKLRNTIAAISKTEDNLYRQRALDHLEQKIQTLAVKTPDHLREESGYVASELKTWRTQLEQSAQE